MPVDLSEFLKVLCAAGTCGQARSVLRGLKRASYSQFGEDAVILSLPGIPPVGAYVDVGSFHPTLYSNTFAMYLRGWRGLLIEPNPAFHQITRKLRPRDTLIPCGVSRTGGRLKYYEYEVAAFNTFSDDRAAELESEGRRAARTVMIDTKPLAQLLAEASCPSAFDVLSVDCEGYDLDVLRSNDWAAYRPRLIVVEDHPLYRSMIEAAKGDDGGKPFSRKGFGSEIHEFLSQEGYLLVSNASYSMIYMESAAVELPI